MENILKRSLKPSGSTQSMQNSSKDNIAELVSEFLEALLLELLLGILGEPIDVAEIQLPLYNF